MPTCSPVQVGDIISRFRVHGSLPSLPGELPLPLYRAQDIAARSWVLVEYFPEDAPRPELEAAAERAEILAAAGGAGRDGGCGFEPLVDRSFDPPAFFAWSLGGGETLRQRLRRSPLSPEQAAETGLALARSLRGLHRAGAVHGGLRPANVQLLDGGRVELLAPSSRGPVTLAAANEAFETPSLWTAAYLSPEQVDGAEAALTGAPAPFTTADDVWTLGVVLHELVTGELPFLATTYGAMRRAVAVQPMDLAGTLPGSAPEAFEAVFAAALDRDADRRRAALDDVIARLRQVKADLRPRVRPPVDSVARTQARKAAVATDRSAAGPAEPEWQSAISRIRRQRRRLAREHPPPALWRVLIGPLAALLLTAAALAAWLSW